MRFNKILALFLTLGVAITACKKDTTQPGAPTASIVVDKTTASPGTVVKASINASSDPARTLKSLKLEEVINGVTTSTLIDSTISTGNIGITYNYTVPSGTNSVELRLTVTDNAFATTTQSATITVTGSGQLKACDPATLGSYDNSTYGSFYSTTECKSYNVSTAKANQSKVDIIYFYGSSNAATLASPDDPDDFGTGTGQISSLDVQTWTSKNPTRFRKTTTANFDNANAASLQTDYASATGTESFKANNLANGDVVAFKTAGGKYGLVKITNITGAGGTATISVKVQQ